MNNQYKWNKWQRNNHSRPWVGVPLHWWAPRGFLGSHPLAAWLLTVGPPVCILQVAWEGGLVGKVVQGRVLDTASL